MQKIEVSFQRTLDGVETKGAARGLSGRLVIAVRLPFDEAVPHRRRQRAVAFDAKIQSAGVGLCLTATSDAGHQALAA
ncbi:hypothetical protein AB4Y38_42160 [Paraburkholderia sp. EG285A]|uniref:hypothetical protein n=1 Tax=Paraburkholderia sp. EG285A TaxID=3237009 RepID=UPI0034D23557